VTARSRFRLTIAWFGDEDKPFPKAILVASSRSNEVDALRPFWSGAVISAEEFERTIAALDDVVGEWHHGEPPATATGYVVIAETELLVRHVVLGPHPQPALRAIEQALAWAHRQPVKDILRRAASAFPAPDAT
jgi:hypothetical protein